jgi:hypothetical protein
LVKPTIGVPVTIYIKQFGRDLTISLIELGLERMDHVTRGAERQLVMDDDGLRLALVSTPRAGNTWLRHMLAQVLDLRSRSAHRPDEVDWASSEPRSIVQIHWEPDDAFLTTLKRYGFRVIVLARHPLDVLLSTLSFSQHDGSTLRWLDGRGGDERCLEGASPTSEAFLAYATGPRAQAILGVSAQWWEQNDVCRMRYEDLVSGAAGQLSGILADLGVAAVRPIADVVAEANPQGMRNLSVGMQCHVWQATPGIWKRLLTPSAAGAICDCHRQVLHTLGYRCDADESLDAARAEQAWERMNSAALKRTIQGLKKAVIELERQRPELEQMRADLKRQISALNEQQATVDALARRLNEIGPWSLGTARTLHHWSLRFPSVAAAFKSSVLIGRRALDTLGRGPRQAPAPSALRLVVSDDADEYRDTTMSVSFDAQSPAEPRRAA